MYKNIKIGSIIKPSLSKQQPDSSIGVQILKKKGMMR